MGERLMRRRAKRARLLGAALVAIGFLGGGIAIANAANCGADGELRYCGHGPLPVYIPPPPKHPHWLDAGPGGGAKVAPAAQAIDGADRADASKAGVGASGGGGHHGGRYN